MIVRTQAELDAALANGEPVIEIRSERGVWLTLKGQPGHLYTGVDAMTGIEYLLTVYKDGTRTLARRPDTWATWSAPITLTRQSAEVS